MARHLSCLPPASGLPSLPHAGHRATYRALPPPRPAGLSRVAHRPAGSFLLPACSDKPMNRTLKAKPSKGKSSSLVGVAPLNVKHRARLPALCASH